MSVPDWAALLKIKCWIAGLVFGLENVDVLVSVAVIQGAGQFSA